MNWEKIGENMKARWQIVVAVIAVIALTIGAIFVVTNGKNGNQAQPASSSSASAIPSAATSPSQNAQASADPRLADCQPLGTGFVPVRFTFERPTADEKVLSLGLDEEGNIAAPPGDQPRTAAWWNMGPKAGSNKGKVVFSIHTYRRGGALGNEMFANEQPQMQVGDIIKLYGAKGEVACYRYAEWTKVWVKDYDPNSDIMVDMEGKPRLLLIICSDLKAGEPAASRIFFYADPVEV